MAWKDLAQHILRQRLVMEGLRHGTTPPEEIIGYLEELALATDMEVINGPGIQTAHEHGYMGWVHWKTSGAAVYTYPFDSWGGNPDVPEANELFTVDCYTCKPFRPEDAVACTENYFRPIDLRWRPG